VADFAPSAADLLALERDRETARLLWARDPEGLRRLIGDHAGRIRNALRKEFGKMLDPLELDEALNQASFRAFHAGGRYDAARAPLPAWFHVVARNCARRILDCKRSRAMLTLIEDLASAPSATPAADDGAELARRQAFADEVHRCIDLLPPQQRSVILADLAAGGTADTEGLARDLATTRNSIYVSRTNGRKALRMAILANGDPLPFRAVAARSNR